MATSLRITDQQAQSAPPGRLPTAFDLACAGVELRRSTAPRAEVAGVLPESAIAALSGRQHPVTRYYANRNMLPTTEQGLHRRVQATQRILVEAGMSAHLLAVDEMSFPWHHIDEAVARRFLQIITARYKSHESRNGYLGVVRLMVRNCGIAGLISQTMVSRLHDCLPVRSGPPRQVGRAATIEELTALIAAALRDEVFGVRDAAMIVTLISTGVRASELVAIQVGDVDLLDRSIAIRRTKGGGEHEVYVHEGAVPYIEAWLRQRGSHSGALFDSPRLRIRGVSMSTYGVRERLDKAQRTAGITEHLTTHDFRRTFITECLDQNVDVFAIARLVGHRRIATTMLYDKRAKSAERRAVESLPFPKTGAGLQR